MLNIGYAQEIITPPVGVGLAGYMNKRPNVGMYDDLYAKAVVFDDGSTRCGVLVYDMIDVPQKMRDILETRISEKFGKTFFDNLHNSAKILF